MRQLDHEATREGCFVNVSGSRFSIGPFMSAYTDAISQRLQTTNWPADEPIPDKNVALRQGG
jgi:hypothetical protein